MTGSRAQPDILKFNVQAAADEKCLSACSLEGDLQHQRNNAYSAIMPTRSGSGAEILGRDCWNLVGTE